MFGLKKCKLFGTRIEPACEYCRHGNKTSDKTMILCEKKGVVAPFYSCNKYLYDPLKRIPQRQKPLPQYDQSDFSL